MTETTTPDAPPPPPAPPPPSPARDFVTDAFRQVGATVEDHDGVLHVRLPEADPSEPPLPPKAAPPPPPPPPQAAADDDDDDDQAEEPEAPDASLGPDADDEDAEGPGGAPVTALRAEPAPSGAPTAEPMPWSTPGEAVDAGPGPSLWAAPAPPAPEAAPATPADAPAPAAAAAPEPQDLSAASDLARRLGTRELKLAFEAKKLTPGVDLVAPGSHVLRALEEHLAHRARRCIVERPAEHRLTLKSLSGVVRGHRGANLVLEERENTSGWDVHVVHRVRYRTLERHDTIQATRVRLRPGTEPLVEALAAPEEAAEWTAQPRRHLPEGLLERALDLADAFVVERSRAEGERREADGRRRAQKDLSRLHAYYSGQIAELERSRRTELAATRIEELEDERALRLHELGATTRVAVEVEPLALLVVEVPLQRATLRIRDDGAERSARGKGDKADDEAPAPTKKKARGKGKKAEAEDEPEEAPPPAPPAAGEEAPPRAPGIEVVFDRATNEVTLGPCPSCDGAADGALERCASGHVVHARCIVPCGKCQTSACSACGSLRCRMCGADVCVACGATCPGCGTLGCSTHVGACAECKRAGCEACLRACAGCGRKVCVEDRVAASKDAKATFCTKCAVSCPSCRKATATAELRRCARCGRKFCKECNAPGAAACLLCAGAM